MGKGYKLKKLNYYSLPENTDTEKVNVELHYKDDSTETIITDSHVDDDLLLSEVSSLVKHTTFKNPVDYFTVNTDAKYSGMKLPPKEFKYNLELVFTYQTVKSEHGSDDTKYENDINLYTILSYQLDKLPNDKPSYKRLARKIIKDLSLDIKAAKLYLYNAVTIRRGVIVKAPVDTKISADATGFPAISVDIFDEKTSTYHIDGKAKNNSYITIHYDDGITKTLSRIYDTFNFNHSYSLPQVVENEVKEIKYYSTKDKTVSKVDYKLPRLDRYNSKTYVNYDNVLEDLDNTIFSILETKVKEAESKFNEVKIS